MTLQEYIKDKEPTFKPGYNYFEHGDFIAGWYEDVQYYEVRMDDLVTLYLNRHNDKVIGYKIKGISTLYGKFKTET